MNKSAKYNKVKGYYDAGMWNEKMLRNAVGRWITEAEAAEILGESAQGDADNE